MEPGTARLVGHPFGALDRLVRQGRKYHLEPLDSGIVRSWGKTFRTKLEWPFVVRFGAKVKK